MEITQLIRHPEQMNRDTLYELRSMLALHPYYQPARLLMLQNLYLLHDAAFDEELRKAAVYVTDRKVIFQMIEAAHYQLRDIEKQQGPARDSGDNRTVALIDSFLDSIPADDAEDTPHRQPTPADAAVDYVAYLMANETIDGGTQQSTQVPQLKGHDLIDTFLEQEQGRIMLTSLPADTIDDEPANDSADEKEEEEYFTETLARIYIRQGRYQKALDIIGRLNEQFPQKNAYFADQMRFLEKLIINSNKQKN